MAHGVNLSIMLGHNTCFSVFGHLLTIPGSKEYYYYPVNLLQGLFPNKGRVTQLFGQKSYLETAPGIYL